MCVNNLCVRLMFQIETLKLSMFRTNLYSNFQLIYSYTVVTAAAILLVYMKSGSFCISRIKVGSMII